MYFAIKILITALIVAGVSEISRRYTVAAAALASLPLTSILTFIWIYHDTKDTTKIIDLSYSIAWMVLPSVLFLLVLPGLLKLDMKFYPALFLSIALMSSGYGLFIYLKK